MNLLHLPFLPESPVWLLSTGKSRDKVRKAISIIAPGRLSVDYVALDNLHRRIATLVDKTSPQLTLSNEDKPPAKCDRYSEN